MSADDDTFEIDIYGDDAPEPEPEPEPAAKEEQQDGAISGDPTNDNGDASTQSAGAATQQELTTSATAQQGVKRKASDEEADLKQEYSGDQSYDDYVDNRPVDPGAMPALKLAELHWWTTEEDVRGFCARAGAEEELHEVSFGEHKINGKSKGEVYLEFSSPQAATAVKREVEAASQMKTESGARKTPFTAFFAPVGNPYKTAAGAGSKKDFSQSSGRGDRGGAYNSFNNRGGNFGGRGNFNNRGGGGGFNNTMRGGMGAQQQGGWGGMDGGMGGYGGGFGANPMMGMPMAYGNMGRGGMMNNMGGMMARGGFGNMGMGNMNMGMMGSNRGGGMMGGRGSWNGGGSFGGGFNGTGGGMQQNDPNKRMKMG